MGRQVGDGVLFIPYRENKNNIDLAYHRETESSEHRPQPRSPQSPSYDSTASTSDDEVIGPLRFVAYFNPQLFVDIRRRTSEHCKRLQRHVEAFNAELAEAKRSRSYDATYRKFVREVERLSYLDTFDIELTPITITSKTGRSIESFQGSITRKEKIWRRRRRYDGFVLLLGHPELPHTAEQLVNLYRAKDMIEKDFQTIKSVVKIRPIYSYTDPKVQAHVTVCMLALLLERTIKNRLREADLPMSAAECTEVLSTCHLNERRTADMPLYDITQVTERQRRILSALGMEHLCDDRHMRERISPRAPMQPKHVDRR